MPLDLTVEFDIHAAPEAVWDALINPDKVKKYFFGTNIHSTWQLGSPVRFTGEWEGQPYEDKGTVKAFDPLRRLQYDYWSSWSPLPDLPENYQMITYTLEPVEGGTRLIIHNDNVANEETKAHSIENWKGIMGEMKKMLENGEL